MARRDGKDRGITFKDGKWWVRLFVNGREKWYRAQNKTQAKALYGRLSPFAKTVISVAAAALPLFLSTGETRAARISRAEF